MPKKIDPRLQVNWNDHLVEERNAWRVIVRVATLVDAQVDGDLDHLPVTVTYPDDPMIESPYQKEYKITTHRELVAMAAGMLISIGFPEAIAINVLFDTKKTKAVIRDLVDQV